MMPRSIRAVPPAEGEEAVSMLLDADVDDAPASSLSNAGSASSLQRLPRKVPERTVISAKSCSAAST